MNALAAQPDLPWTQADPLLGDPRSWQTEPALPNLGPDLSRIATIAPVAGPADAPAGP